MNSSESTRLNLVSLPHDKLKLTIRDILSITQIYHLEILKEFIFSNTLIDIIYKLSSLNSLKISSLILSNLSSIDKQNLRFISNKNKITKVYLEKINQIEEIYFLMKLCPRMIYFKVNFINNMDIQLFVKAILMKINNDCNQYLRSVCLHISTEDDQIIHKLKQIHHFTIQHIFDNIYLEWNSLY